MLFACALAAFVAVRADIFAAVAATLDRNKLYTFIYNSTHTHAQSIAPACGGVAKGGGAVTVTRAHVCGVGAHLHQRGIAGGVQRRAGLAGALRGKVRRGGGGGGLLARGGGCGLARGALALEQRHHQLAFALVAYLSPR